MAFTPSLKTMATVPRLIQVGPGFIWFNVDKPADGATLAVSGYASGSMDHKVYGPALFTASGTFGGATIGESGLAYKVQFVDINIESSTAKVEKVLMSEEARVSVSMAELTAENFSATMPGNAVNPIAALKATTADPLSATQFRHTATVGGIRLVDPQCIAFISPNRRIGATGSDIFSYVFCGYNAISVEGFDTAFSKGKETVWRVVYELIADTGRTIGDQLFQFTVRQGS